MDNKQSTKLISLRRDDAFISRAYRLVVDGAVL